MVAVFYLLVEIQLPICTGATKIRRSFTHVLSLRSCYSFPVLPISVAPVQMDGGISLVMQIPGYCLDVLYKSSEICSLALCFSPLKILLFCARPILTDLLPSPFQKNSSGFRMICRFSFKTRIWRKSMKPCNFFALAV